MRSENPAASTARIASTATGRQRMAQGLYYGIVKYLRAVRLNGVRRALRAGGIGATVAPDRVLVIGPDAQVPGFFWLAGQGGYGFQTCPAASRLAADLIGGRAPEIGADLVAALAPARFG